MIKFDNRHVLQHRIGETKTKDAGKIMQHPADRKPFFYINGVCLTADDCFTIMTELQVVEAKYHLAK